MFEIFQILQNILKVLLHSGFVEVLIIQKHSIVVILVSLDYIILD